MNADDYARQCGRDAAGDIAAALEVILRGILGPARAATLGGFDHFMASVGIPILATRLFVQQFQRTFNQEPKAWHQDAFGDAFKRELWRLFAGEPVPPERAFPSFDVAAALRADNLEEVPQEQVAALTAEAQRRVSELNKPAPGRFPPRSR